MAQSVLLYFVLILAVFSLVSTFPSGKFDSALWQLSNRNSNISLVEHCYYDFAIADWPTLNYPVICHLIANTTVKHRRLKLPMPLEAIRPLQMLFKDYATTEKNDKTTVLEYFFKHRYHLPSNCETNYKWGKRTDQLVTRREVYAQAYYNQLRRAQRQIDYCLRIEKRHLPLPANCAFLDDIELVEHCVMHHTRDYEPCQGISYPEIAQPVDAVSLYRYIAWKNVTSTFEYPAWQNEMVRESPDLKMVLDCLHQNSWLKYPSHPCQNVTHQREDVQYSKLDVQRHELFKKIEAKDIERDCKYFHQDEVKSGHGRCAKFKQ